MYCRAGLSCDTLFTEFPLCPTPEFLGSVDVADDMLADGAPAAAKCAATRGSAGLTRAAGGAVGNAERNPARAPAASAEGA